jgi:hypothetical protein
MLIFGDGSAGHVGPLVVLRVRGAVWTADGCARTAHGGVDNGSGPAPKASERDR